MYKSLLIVSILCVFGAYCHQGHHQDHQINQQNGQHNNQNSMMENINKDHVLEHLDGVINKPKDQMTIDEQNFYYFKLHDYDNNNMLDGLELVSAFAHNEEHNVNDPSNATQQQQQKPPRISDEELMKLIDGIMKDEDKNLDGYITYQEFLHAIK
ncbi:unnamed protein product, partial [Brachionus calyciflorus]